MLAAISSALATTPDAYSPSLQGVGAGPGGFAGALAARQQLPVAPPVNVTAPSVNVSNSFSPTTNVTQMTQGDNAGMSQTTTGHNSPVSIAANGTNSPVTISSATGVSISAPPGMLGLPSGGVNSGALAAGAAASNIGALGGDLAGSLPSPTVVGLTHANANSLQQFASNAAAITGGLVAGQIYLNTAIMAGEFVLCAVH